MSRAKLPVIFLGVALVGWWGVSKTRSLSAPQSLEQQAEAEASADALQGANAAEEARSVVSVPVAAPRPAARAIAPPPFEGLELLRPVKDQSSPVCGRTVGP
jgi:hypothetical protein